MFQQSTSDNDHNVIPIQQDHNYEYSHDDHLWNYLLDDDELFLSAILPYQPPTPTPTTSLPPPPPPPPPKPCNMDEIETVWEQDPQAKEQRKAVRGKSKRKPGKKDRHSKIHTAHGPRDRRMRLSLQIARKFFDLQDMLGFDKASKTIEWLFNKSKAAIKDLAEKGSCSTSLAPSSPSEDTNICDGGGGDANLSFEITLNKQVGKKGGLQTKENREKARARARKRTKEKEMMKKQGKQNNNNTDNTLEMEQNPRNSRNDMEDVKRVDEQLQRQPHLEDQMASVEIIEKFLASSSSLSNLHHLTHQPCALPEAHSSDQIMQYNDLPFEDDWVQENGRINDEYVALSDDLPTLQGPNSAFIMSRPYNATREYN